MKLPVVFKTSTTDQTTKLVHLQCISGIHINPVSQKRNVKVDTRDKLINMVDTRERDYSEIIAEIEWIPPDDNDDDEMTVLVSTQRNSCNCKHNGGDSMCTCIVYKGNHKLCVLVDSGAQVSLITEETWEKLKLEGDNLKFSEINETDWHGKPKE